MNRFACLVPLLTLATPTSARAALTLTYERVTADPPQKLHEVLTIDPRHLRLESTGNGKVGVIIVDLAAKKIFTVDPQQRTYREVNASERAERHRKLVAKSALIRARMQTMSPEGREAAEAALASLPSADQPPEPTIVYEPLHATKKVGTTTCELYRVHAGEQELNQSCVVPWNATKTTAADHRALEQFSNELHKAFGSWAGMNAQDWSKAPGLPVEQLHQGGQQRPDWTATLVSTSHAAVPASAFAVPPGYERADQKRHAGALASPHGSPHGSPH